MGHVALPHLPFVGTRVVKNNVPVRSAPEKGIPKGGRRNFDPEQDCEREHVQERGAKGAFRENECHPTVLRTA